MSYDNELNWKLFHELQQYNTDKGIHILLELVGVQLILNMKRKKRIEKFFKQRKYWFSLVSFDLCVENQFEFVSSKIVYKSGEHSFEFR